MDDPGRTELVPIELETNGNAEITTDPADASNGMYVAVGQPERLLLMVENESQGDCEITVKAGPYFRGGLGDLVFTVSPGIALIGPFESARVEQAGSELHIDLDTDSDIALAALLLPA